MLLKNENGALPIKTSKSDTNIPAEKNPKISVFGQNSINIAYGGSGSGGGNTGDAVDLYTALANAGYAVNPTLKQLYEKSGVKRTQNSGDLDSGDTVFLSTGELPVDRYGSVKSSFAEYRDAALVVFTRIGGEGSDLPRSMKGQAGARNDDDHYLQLDKNETELLEMVCSSGFEKVIVVINSAGAMELGFLEKPDYYAYQSGIDAALWIGFPGNSGLNALGNILNGNVNPSGRTVDTYVTDLKKDPTWFNFGDNNSADGDQYTLDGKPQLYYFVDYEESVYVGYRYYETRGVTDGESWYDKAVVYPFGYGLSYTKFEWELADASAVSGKTITKDGKYEIKVKVKNIGDVAGKEVVQLYGHAPYTPGKIEKPEEILLDFAKTPMLYPASDGDTAEKPNSATVTLTFDPYYLASYDYKDANGNGYKGFELDAGDYALYISENAHDKKFAVPFSSTNIRYGYSTVNADVKVENRYTDCEDEMFDSDLGLETVLSRSDWGKTFPARPTAEERAMSSELYDALRDVSTNNPHVEEYENTEVPWFGVSEISLTLRNLLTNEETGEYGSVDYDDVRWEELLDKCTEDELVNMYDYGAFTSAKVLSINKPATNDTDGPSGFTNFMSKDGTYHGTCFYCSEPVMAATWNEELVEELGVTVGNEGIWGADGKGNLMPYSGWYAPGVNIHRSPFGGRNAEYFSEDGVLNGKMAAAEIRGCRSKGVYCFVKHFALNEQETHRSINGDVTWATEQSMREIYLRAFEIAVKDGDATAVMSSFNRIGTRWTGGDYRLLTEILRDEWGFKGMVICDFNTVPQYMNSRQMAYAGGDLNLVAYDPVSWYERGNTADAVVLRKCAKNVMYTVANSNAMNREIVGYSLPIWTIVLIVVDVAAFVGICVWGFFAVRGFVLGRKRGNAEIAESVEADEGANNDGQAE